ncbi:MFS transporter [Streptomyces purpureus]|uniref:MFS transporter n=1 Tax=Streptomyces purpureus TaxID=1951 RepID=UPI0037B5EF6A
MPLAIAVLAVGVFCVNTTEIMVAGLLPSISEAFGVSVSSVGYLVSVFALTMVVGGPLLTVALLRASRKKALIGLLLVFVAGQLLGAVAQDYWVLVVSRVVTALAASAFYGIAVAVSARLVGPDMRARALSVLMSGMMVAQVVGLPVAAFVDQHFGWRASFYGLAALAALCALLVWARVPDSPVPQKVNLRGELDSFRNRALWAAYGTNALVIGSVVAAFSYFAPIFEELTGFPSGVTPLLFALFGIGTIAGNMVTGRLADRYMMPVLLYGLAGLTAVLAAFALVAENKPATVVAVAVLGVIGLPLNPALGVRVMRLADDGPMVSTVNASAVNVGVALGPWVAGLAISAEMGLRAPLWVGAAMALAGLLSLLPALGRGGRAATGDRHEPAGREPAADREPVR